MRLSPTVLTLLPLFSLLFSPTASADFALPLTFTGVQVLDTSIAPLTPFTGQLVMTTHVRCVLRKTGKSASAARTGQTACTSPALKRKT
jgi:hypothetical protein